MLVSTAPEEQMSKSIYAVVPSPLLKILHASVASPLPEGVAGDAVWTSTSCLVSA